MNILHAAVGLGAAAVLACSNCVALAEVTRIEIASRADILGGQPFGAAGAYEKIIGKVYFSVDPRNPHNAAVVDLDEAPIDAADRVAFSADLYVIAPQCLSEEFLNHMNHL